MVAPHWILLPLLGVFGNPQDEKKSEGNFIVVELVTDGAKVIAIAREASDPEGKKEVSLSLDSFAGAGDLADDLVKARKKAYGDGHWRVTDARLMAAQLKKLEKLNEEQILRLKGAAVLHSRAREHLSKGKLEAALPLSREAWKVRSELLGRDVPLTMVSFNDIAYCLHYLRQFTEAEKLYLQGLEISKKAYGENHPDYAHVLSGMAGMHYEKGDYAKAEPLWLKSAAIRKATLGAKHEDYASNLNNLAALYGSLARYEESARLFKESLAIRKETLGEKHPDYAENLNSLAKINSHMGKYAESETLYRRALEIRKAEVGENHADYAKSLDGLAGLYNLQGRYNQATALYEKALAIRKEVLGEKHKDYALCLNNLAWVYCGHMRQYSKALPLYEKAEAILRDHYGEKHPEYLTCLDNLAAVCCDLGQYPKSESLYEKVVARRKEILGEKHPDTLVSLSGQASLYNLIGRRAEAGTMLERVLAIRKETVGEKHPDYADSLNALALHYKSVGRDGRSEPLLRQVLDIRRNTVGTKHVSYLVALNNLSAIYREMGQYAKAAELSRQAIELARETVGEKHYYYALTLHSLASAYDGMGQPAKAEALLEQALALCKEISGEKSADYVAALHNLASHYVGLLQFSKAEPLQIKAATIAREVLGENHPFYLTALAALANQHSQFGEDSTAEGLYRSIVKIRRETLGEKHPDYASALHELAFHYKKIDQPGRAFPLYRKALAIQKEVLGEDNLAYAATLYNLAALHFDMREFEEAEPMLIRSRDIAQKILGDQHPSYATYLDGLATLYQAKGEADKAVALSLEALRIARRHLDQTAEVQNEQSQMGYARYYQLKLNRYLTIALDSKSNGDEVYTQVLAWKGSVWTRQHYMRRMSNALKTTESAEAPKLASRLADARRKLANRVFTESNLKVDVQREEETVALYQEVERLEKALGKESAAYRLELEKRRVTAEQLRQSLPADAVLIDFLEYMLHTPHDNKKPGSNDPCLAAFVIRRDQPTVRVELGPMEKVTQAVEAWREALTNGPQRGEDKQGAAVRKLIWEPLEAALKDAKLILISPDECLGRLPFAALPGKAKGRFLLEERAVAVIAVPQLLPELLEPTAKQETASSVLLLGDVDFNGSRSQAVLPKPLFSPLPGTREELTSIRASFQKRFNTGKVTELRETEASEEGFCREAVRHRYLHLATHGFFAEEAAKTKVVDAKATGLQPIRNRQLARLHPGLQCGIALAGANQPKEGQDGILTALELSDLDLSGVDLVTLSACGTGLGKSSRAEGLQGLQRACQVAGAKTVVASLWKVDDRATQTLMTEFYRNLWDRKLSKLESLRQAQLAMLNRYDVAKSQLRGPGEERPVDPKAIASARPEGTGVAPFFWAAFVLSGDWR